MGAVTNEFCFESPCAAAEGLAVLCDPSKTWKPVPPPRSTHGLQRGVAKLQAGDIRSGFACPICQVGLIPVGDAICEFCAAEIEEAEELP